MMTGVIVLLVILVAVLIAGFVVLARLINTRYQTIKEKEVRLLENRATTAELLAGEHFLAEAREQARQAKAERDEFERRLGNQIAEQLKLAHELEREQKDRSQTEAALEALIGVYEDDNAGLFEAARRGHVAVAEYFLERGADVNAVDSDGWTPLYWAASQGDTEVAQLLLEAGTDVNAADHDAQTPLHLATWQGHTEMVQLLLERGADVNASNDDGWTPLHSAASQPYPEVLELLLAAGADVNAMDTAGSTPLMLGDNEEVRQLLRQHGAED